MEFLVNAMKGEKNEMGVGAGLAVNIIVGGLVAGVGFLGKVVMASIKVKSAIEDTNSESESEEEES